VRITYDQAANFFSYRVNPGDAPVNSPGGMFVLYRITKVKNSAGIPFTFDKHSVLAGEPGKTRNEEPAADGELLGDKLVSKLEIGAGKTVNDPGCVIKLVDAAETEKSGKALIPATYEKQKMERATDDNVTTPFTVATSIASREPPGGPDFSYRGRTY